MKLTTQKMRTRARKRCVKLAKDIVKQKANYHCEKCGRSDKQIQGSHILPEGRYTSLSAEPENILCLCAGCHMWSSDSWHENPIASAEWFNEKFPGRYKRLLKKAQQNIKVDWVKEEINLKKLCEESSKN